MKLFFAMVMAFAIGSPAFAHGGSVYVHGYTRSNGTYVAPHMRSAPDGNPYNNWSTIGNTNPYTGEAGTHQPRPTLAYPEPMPVYPSLPEPPAYPAYPDAGDSY